MGFRIIDIMKRLYWPREISWSARSSGLHVPAPFTQTFWWQGLILHLLENNPDVPRLPRHMLPLSRFH